VIPVPPGAGRRSATGTTLDSGADRRARRRIPAGVWFVLPALALLVLFRAAPLVEGVRLSFTEWKGFVPPRFLGIDNYVDILTDPVIHTALIHNGIILLTVPIWVLLPFFLATILHRRIWGWRFFRMAFFAPALVSPVIVGIFFELMLRENGPINTALRGLGLGFLATQWLVDLDTALPVVIIIIIWAMFGMGVLIFLAALDAVDPQLHDAAKIDGASWLQTQRYVVLPEISSVLQFYTVIMVIASFTGLFPFVYTLTRGGPGNATEVIDLAIYRAAFQSSELGYASAVGVIMVLLALALVWIALAVTRRGTKADA